jgi:hypothetical protein
LAGLLAVFEALHFPSSTVNVVHGERGGKDLLYVPRLMFPPFSVPGYPGDAARFEGRLAGLLAAFEALQLPPATTRLFHVMGGECNYLLAVNEQYRLEFVDDALWKLDSMLEWREEEVTELLDDAEVRGSQSIC